MISSMFKNSTELLIEDTRAMLIANSEHKGDYKDQSKGKNRFERKRFSKIANTVKAYNDIDMNKLYKQDELEVKLPIIGETNTYYVTISMNGVITELAKIIKNNKNYLDYKAVVQAVSKMFNTNNIYIKCTCPDYKYTYAHWNIQKNVSVDDTSKDPGPGKGIRNPKDEKGRGCKHVLLILSNKDWILKVSSTIHNYIHYAEEKLQKPFLKLIFPKLYGVRADEMVDKDLIDDDKYLDSSKGLIDAINEYGRKRGQYPKGSNKNPVTEKEKQKTGNKQKTDDKGTAKEQPEPAKKN